MPSDPAEPPNLLLAESTSNNAARQQQQQHQCQEAIVRLVATAAAGAGAHLPAFLCNNFCHELGETSDLTATGTWFDFQAVASAYLNAVMQRLIQDGARPVDPESKAVCRARRPQGEAL